jgi:drug/metabolite transporter (DMT)-like permease
LGLGYLLTALGALGISTAPILFALSRTDPAVGVLFRFGYALPVLVAVCALRPDARRAFARRDQRGWLRFGAGAGLFFALDLLLYHHSIQRIGAGPATLLANTQVVWLALFGLAVLGERPAARFWLALPVLLIGTALLGGATLAGFARAADRDGLLLGAGSGAMYAGALLCLRQAQLHSRIPPEAALTAQIAVGLAVIAAATWWEQGGVALQLSAAQHGWLVLLALGPQVVAWVCISAGIRHIPAHHTGAMLMLQPVSSLVLGWWILDQALSARRLLGALLVLGGIALSLAGRR